MRRRPCERCGQWFTGRRSTARFCSESCRKASWREHTAAVEAADDGAPAPWPPLVAVGDDGSIAEAVAASAHSGLVAVAAWLAETLDQLEGPARATHGPRVAGQLVATLKLLGRPAKPEERPPSKLQALRDARAAQDARSGWAT